MTGDAPRRRSAGFLIGMSLIAALLFAGFVSLGVWQLHRLAWKRALIAQVDGRIHAPPVPAPRSAAPDAAYLRVSASGVFLNDRATLVQASTVRGAGYWVMVPLVTDRGFILMVNRGFVPPEAKAGYDRPTGQERVVGLVRLTEPRGGFLRDNNPAQDRWYSRDVEAISRARKLGGEVTNYFVDAERSGSAASLPVGGLTIVSFPNDHLSYAITWFALAVMTAGGYMLLMRHEWKAGLA